MSTTADDKSALRREIKSRLDGMTSEERGEASRRVCTRILDLAEYRRAKTVMLYLAFGAELVVDDLFHRGLQDDKRIVVPRVDWSSRTMDVVQLESLDDDSLIVDERGIRTPRHGPPVAPGEIDLIVAPGLAFDVTGHRLGRSGGFYDRLLDGIGPKAVCVGVAFERQFVDEIPTEDHDQRVDIVATEARLIRVSG